MRTLLIASILAAACQPAAARLVLASRSEAVPVVLAPSEPGFLRIAANDLISDVRRIAGRTLPVGVSLAACARGCVLLASASVPESRAVIGKLAPDLLPGLQGKTEAARLRLLPPAANAAPVLLIAGSDPHGTMFGLYDLLERELAVDPMYRWSGLVPQRRDELAIDALDRPLPPPSVRWRGWFLNDEDLLTEWRDGGGPRDIDYPFYQQVTAPDVLDRVFESMLRLKYNLVIPASFTDIDNPAEERMVQAAARRGLAVSMHHVEPMGVSAFAFFNYWRARGRQVAYSYSSDPAAFEQVWTHYAQRWAKVPNVIWQVGLRGIADRPVWLADTTAPRDDAGRGRLISNAIAKQVEIIRQALPPSAKPLITTTLWMEGAILFRQGHLKLPPEVTVVFADNSPGWNWQQDFHQTPREPGRAYGAYYHHAVWGWGPHLVQAVPPQVTERMLKEAYRKNGGRYVISNVANVREFALGLAATAELLWDIDRYDSAAFLSQWTRRRFRTQAAAAEQAYRRFFDAYVIHETRGTPDLLDGLALHEGERIARAILDGKHAALFQPPAKDAAGDLHLNFPSLRRVGEETPDALLLRLNRQLQALDAALDAARAVRLHQDPAAKAFFEANLIGQARILRGICRWTAALAQAAIALREKRPPGAALHLREAQSAFEEIRAGQALNSQGEWSDWYRGDRKMNLNRAEAWTRQLIEKL